MSVAALKLLLARPAWRLVTATVRCNTSSLAPRPTEGPVIFACLHRDILPAILYVRPARPYLLVSRSLDGELLVRALGPEGIGFVRGATGEAGASPAFRGLLDVLMDGANVGVAVDGPRGPFGHVRHGVLQLARRSGASVVPLVARVSRARQLGTWDYTVVPYPFARAVVEAAEPVAVPSAADDVTLAACRRLLRRRLGILAAETPGEEDERGDP